MSTRHIEKSLALAGALVLALALPAARAGYAWDHTSTVTVNVDGKPAENIEVRLVFQNNLDGRDVSRIYRTDAHGKAVISHSGRGRAHVFIFNEWTCHGTEGDAPCDFLVNLSTANRKQALMLDKWVRRPKRADDTTTDTGVVLTNRAPAASGGANTAPPEKREYKSIGVIGGTSESAASRPSAAVATQTVVSSSVGVERIGRQRAAAITNQSTGANNVSLANP